MKFVLSVVGTSILTNAARKLIINPKVIIDHSNTRRESETAFGDTDEASYVTFYDALYVPDSGYNRGAGPQALQRDVLTVHHQKYYQGKPDAPADWDEPVPVPFLSATGKYLIALAGPSDWVNATFEILEMALLEEGIGAKTSSGYGRMILE